MSELTPCNYCSLEIIRFNAKRKGKIVTIKRYTFGEWSGAQAIFVHQEGVEPIKDDRVSWMAEISNHCCC